MKVKVTLKSGKVIEVLPSEVAGLKGLIKEDKIASETKEFKVKTSTTNPPISTKNIKGRRPKKVR